MAQVVYEALKFHDGDKYNLLSWSIMPNHVHVLIKTKDDLSKIIQSWKSFTGKWALKNNKKYNLGIPQSANKVWMPEFWDRFIRDEEHFNNTVAYILNNPSKSKLPKESAAYRFLGCTISNGAKQELHPSQIKMIMTRDKDDPKKNGDFAWVQHMFASLNVNGRMAVVLPHGVLFRGGDEGKIRTKLLKENRIEAIIGVASNLFYGTGIPACILVLRTQRPKVHKNHILIINAEEIFTKGRAQNTLSNSQADEIYEIYQAQEQQGPSSKDIKGADEIEGVARWVHLTEVKENDFNLNIARYVQKPLEEETITVEEALKDFQSKLADLEQAEEELEALLIKEGFEI